MTKWIRRFAAWGFALLLAVPLASGAAAANANYAVSDAVRGTLNTVELGDHKTKLSGLDKAVGQILDDIIDEEMDAADRLKASFDFVVRYMNNDKEDPGIRYSGGWGTGRDVFRLEEAWAERALDMGFGGTCPEYASLFLMLARRQGFEGNLMIGDTPAAGGGLTEHKWVEIHVGDTVYVCDPFLEQTFVARNLAAPGTFFCTTYEKQGKRFVNGRAPVKRVSRTWDGGTFVYYE